jgi:hypothetical protein
MADSSGWLGAKPLDWICAALEALCQSSLVAMVLLSETRTSCSVGLGSAPGTPKFVSDGPIARTTTVFGLAPLTTKPPIITSKPVCTWPRVEMFASRGGSALRSLRASVSVAPIGASCGWSKQFVPSIATFETALRPITYEGLVALARGSIVNVASSWLEPGVGGLPELTVPPKSKDWAGLVIGTGYVMKGAFGSA